MGKKTVTWTTDCEQLIRNCQGEERWTRTAQIEVSEERARKFYKERREEINNSPYLRNQRLIKIMREVVEE